jgi:hypothetical protein
MTLVKKFLLKKIFFFFITITLFLALTLCNGGYGRINDKNLQSTDLSGVTIAGLRLGSNANDLEMSIFRETDRGYILFGFVSDELLSALPDDAYTNDEVYIDIEPDGIITRINGRVHFGVEFEINGVDNPQSLQEIKDLLGDNYNDYLYSRELRWNGLTYTDTENDICLTFFYDMSDDSLIWWAILSSPDD